MLETVKVGQAQGFEVYGECQRRRQFSDPAWRARNPQEVRIRNLMWGPVMWLPLPKDEGQANHLRDM